MTVLLNAPYGAFGAGASVDLDNATEAALVAQGRASYTINPGSLYAPLTPTEQQNLRDALPWLASSGYMMGYTTGPQQKTDADANESAALYTLNIPANTLGPNSVLIVLHRWSFTDTTATWNLRTRFGGTVPDNLSITGNATLIRSFEIANRNSLSLQDNNPNNAASFGTFSASVMQTSNVDFSTAQQLTITAQASAAGTGSKIAKLVNARVIHYYGA